MKKRIFGIVIAIVAMLTAFVTGFSFEKTAYAVDGDETVSSFYL